MRVSVSIDAATRQLVRNNGDPIGDSILMWCATHNEPAWLYDDGSSGCWWETTVEATSPDHEIVPGPWELHNEPYVD